MIFPAAANGILTGFLLGLARAAGETAPLLFTALGNERFEIGQIMSSGVPVASNQFSTIFRQHRQRSRSNSLPLTLWKYAQQPFPERVEQSWAVALVLMIFVLIINVTARACGSKAAHRRMKEVNRMNLTDRNCRTPGHFQRQSRDAGGHGLLAKDGSTKTWLSITASSAP